MLLGSRPICIRTFATLKLFAAVSRMRSSVEDRSALLIFIGFPGLSESVKQGIRPRPDKAKREIPQPWAAPQAGCLLPGFRQSPGRAFRGRSIHSAAE